MAGTAGELVMAAAACIVSSAPVITISDDELTLADVVSLDCIAEDRRQTLAQLPIATLNAGAVELTRAGLASLVHRRLPALDVETGDGDAIVRVTRRAPSPQRTCYVATAPFAAGEAIGPGALERAPCPDSSTSASVRYDRDHGVMRARANIAPGDNLGPLMAAPVLRAERGETLSLRVAEGPVVIERPVEALQPSTGDAIFVKDAEGHVFSAPLVEAGPP